MKYFKHMKTKAPEQSLNLFDCGKENNITRLNMNIVVRGYISNQTSKIKRHDQ